MLFESSLAHNSGASHQGPSYQEIPDPGMLPLAADVEMSLALGKLVVVVGEREVNSTGMDVHFVSKLVRSHDRALDMPTRSAKTPRAWPERLALLGLFPPIALLVRPHDSIKREKLTVRNHRIASFLPGFWKGTPLPPLGVPCRSLTRAGVVRRCCQRSRMRIYQSRLSRSPRMQTPFRR